MSERERQVLAVYAAHRLGHQRDFYDERRAEYDEASGQAALVTAVLVVLGGVAGVLAGADAFGIRTGWAILAAAAPAFATALAAYEALYGFERNAKLYRDASRGLTVAEHAAPDEAAGPEAARAWIEGVEDVLRREQGQWGQLARDAAPR